MNSPLAPTPEVLEEAYRAHDPNLAGHQQAEAVSVGPEGISVLCSANPKGEVEHTWLIRLADDGGVLWERRYEPGRGTGRAFAALPGGGFVVAGDVRRGEMEYQACLMRLDAEGNFVAGGSFGPRGVTGFVAVTVLADGSTLAGGTAGWKGWLVRADERARAVWQLKLDDVEDVHSVAPLAEGGFASAASMEKSTTELGMTRLAAHAAGGRVVWQKRLPAEGRGEASALAALGGGGLVAVGHRSSGEGDATRLWVARLDESGEVAWERLLGRDGEERRGRAVATFADGGVAAAGDATRDGGRGLRVARLDAGGAVAWEREYGGAGGEQDVARGLAATADGGLVLVGSTTGKGPGKTNVRVLRLDPEGEILWDRIFGPAS